MIISNFRFSLRHLGRKKLNTTLHVVGLTLGMSVCLVIGLFLRYELSFDNYHDKADRIYRVNSIWTEANKKFHLYATPIPLAEALRNEVAGLEKVALARPQFRSIIEVSPQKLYKQEHILIVEPQFLDIFKVEWIRGNRIKALSLPYQAILTETIARKFYGDENPIGKTFKYRNKFLITVTGVIRDLPSNTNLPASILLSYVANDEFLDNGDTWYFGGLAWTKLAAVTYVLLEENYDSKNLEAQLKSIADKNINSAPTLDKAIRGDFEIQPLRDIHFDKEFFGGGPWVAAVSRSWLWVFAAIGLVVLALACINFLNLSTAQALTRAKEVGIRKTVGARKTQLISQFLVEAFTLTLVSGVLAVAIAMLSLHSINNLIDKGITIQPLQSPGLMTSLLLGIVLTGLLAGLYPAWVIAKFNPIIALKAGSSGAGIHGASWLRKGLVVVQFTISAALFMIVLVISRQVDFMRGKDLGFEKENVVNVELGGPGKAEILVQDLRQLKGVKDVSLTRSSPISDDHWWNTMSLTKDSERQSVCAVYGDDHFHSVFGLRLLSGRILTPSEYIAQPIRKVVVNEKLLQALSLGSPQEAVGKHFWWGDDTEIAGVVADFNGNPLQYGIFPTLIAQDPAVYSQVSIKLEEGEDIVSALSSIEVVWKKAFPEGVYEFKFLDDQIDTFYKTEMKFNSLFRIFAGLAILISCLGLWGLVTFASQQRTKEIGIRKVLGASVKTIVTLLSKDFLRLVIIAFVISSPLTYYGMNALLQNFAFRIDIGWQVFVIAGASLIVIALLTVSFQTIKAALANPVESLKSE